MQPKRSAIRREWWAGGTMVILGVGAIVESTTYSMGSLARMGPGMFPAILGAILIFLGLLIVRLATSPLNIDTSDDSHAVAAPEWRGWTCIIGGLLAFMLVGRFGGLVPATFVLVFVAAMGDRQHTLRSAALLATAVTVIGVAVFSWGLQLQFPLFRWG
ncbi:MAG: tripartite tricarboxylate transporter TctB family protein [Burkholderiaceae bacterium]|nr:tripartite tricarboxylate transporter TctB family protein [Burkholderiaceae bacterium]